MKLDPATLCGKTIAARYRLERAIGSGTMGCVFEAQELGTDRRVALKLLHEAQPQRMARLQREVHAMSSVSSPHIAASLSAGVDDELNLPYHVMELLVGEQLQDVLTRCKVLAPRAVLSIAAQVCDGLALAHATGVIHRDVKPANLFIVRDQESLLVKLLDFGLAKLMGPSFFGPVAGHSGNLTKPRSLIGSPRYMSPEQARGTREIDRRTDIWSLGVIMYEALAGVSPHGDASSVGDRILRICVKDPAPLDDVAPDVPAEVRRIVMRAVTRDREQRYASAAALREELLEWLGGSCELRVTDLAPRA